jgi:hypothetical protein
MKSITRQLVAAAFSIATLSAASAADNAADRAKDRAQDRYKAAMERCESLKGNAQDVCEKEAKAARDKSRADANVAAKGTAESRADAGETKAKADYRVAMERCESLRGNEQDACESKAKAMRDRRQADVDKQRRN